MTKRSKKVQEALKKADAIKAYSVEEVVALARDINTARFNATVEVVYELNVDPKETDQQICGAVVFPNGAGKTQTVLALAEGEKTREAEAAGVGFVGDDDIVTKIQDGWPNFDAVVVTLNMMVTIGKLGRVLGSKGLMPNPKAGAVAMDVTKAVEEVKAGRVTYRVDKAGNIHVPIGRVSFNNKELVENFNTINDVLLKAKPSTIKGRYIKNISVTTTFGPRIHVDQASF